MPPNSSDTIIATITESNVKAKSTSIRTRVHVRREWTVADTVAVIVESSIAR